MGAPPGGGAEPPRRIADPGGRLWELAQHGYMRAPEDEPGAASGAGFGLALLQVRSGTERFYAVVEAGWERLDDGALWERIARAREAGGWAG
jgi:hypothetical protein